MQEPDKLKTYVADTFSAIWNERMPGRIDDLYRHNARVVRGMRTELYGREQYLDYVVAVQAALPDLVYTVEKVLAVGGGAGAPAGDSGAHAGDASGDARVYLRWRIRGSHLGYGFMGPPTGEEVSLAGMSVCRFSSGRISCQWDADDEAAVLDQLEIDKDEYLGRNAFVPPRFDPMVAGDGGRNWGQDAPPDLPPPGPQAQPGEIVEHLLKAFWNRRGPGRLRQTHGPDCVYSVPGYGSCSASDYMAYCLSLIQMMPNLRIYVDDVISEGNGREAAEVAVLWTMQGLHRAEGRWGRPSNRQLTVPVISEYGISGGRIDRERMLFGELDVFRYIYCYQQRRDAGGRDADGREGNGPVSE